MKKMICFVLALLISFSSACIATAAAFTESIENKGAPALLEILDEHGNRAAAKLTGDVPAQMRFVSNASIIVTSVMDAETSEGIPEASQKILMEVYAGLKDGSIQLPFQELDERNAEKLVVRDLFDISMTDGTENGYGVLLEAEGIALEMTFEMNLAPEAQVYVMVYKKNAWQQIERVTNNGDGTLTCVFEHLCPVAVIVEESTSEVVAGENAGAVHPDGQNIYLWIGVLAACTVALALICVKQGKKQK